MKQAALVAGLVVLLGVHPAGAPPQDAVARLRHALGGHAALSAIQTIRAKGTLPATPEKGYFEMVAALPDRFVQTVRTFPMQDAAWSTRMNVYSSWACRQWRPSSVTS
jgi:hypothetical protein